MTGCDGGGGGDSGGQRAPVVPVDYERRYCTGDGVEGFTSEACRRNKSKTESLGKVDSQHSFR